MRTQNMSNLQIQGTTYREFSRRRYRELKAQSSNLRESEIVSKVIKQWENIMSMQTKNQSSTKHKMMMLNVEPISTPLKEEMVEKKGKTNQKTTGEKKVQNSEMMEGSGLSEMEGINVREFDEQSPKQMKTKKIMHARNRNNNEYIIFFKSYFQKLMLQHPNWNARQVTSIIKLLWKKRKASETKVAKPTKLEKPMSGRTAFRKMKDIPSNTAANMWKRLPMETRKLWQMKGQAGEVQEKMKTRMNMQMTLKLSQQNSTENLKIKGQRELLNMRMM